MALIPIQREIRHNFTLWIKRLLQRKVSSPDMDEIEHIEDLLEADTMLAERIESWFDEATRKGIQQGMLKGREEGREEGRLEGQAKLLARLLQRRFGELPAEVVERLSLATQEELETWGEAILSAPTLSAVFGTRWH